MTTTHAAAPTPASFHWILLHAYRTDDAVIDDWVRRITELLGGAMQGVHVVVSGRDDFREAKRRLHVPRNQFFNAWAQDVLGKDKWTGAYRFAGGIVPTGVCVPTADGPVIDDFDYVSLSDDLMRMRGLMVGKPTYQMVEGFLDSGRSVALWDPATSAMLPVVDRYRELGNNYKTWGRLVPQNNG